AHSVVRRAFACVGCSVLQAARSVFMATAPRAQPRKAIRAISGPSGLTFQFGRARPARLVLVGPGGVIGSELSYNHEQTCWISRDSDNERLSWIPEESRWYFVKCKGVSFKKPEPGFLRSKSTQSMPHELESGSWEVCKSTSGITTSKNSSAIWEPDDTVYMDTVDNYFHQIVDSAISTKKKSHLDSAIAFGCKFNLRDAETMRNAQRARRFWDFEWNRKAQEVASRGIKLRHMLDFYEHIVCGQYGKKDPTTAEIVHDIIKHYTDTDRASLTNQYPPMGNDGISFPHYHVIHAWGSRHCDVLSALVYHLTEFTTRATTVAQIESDLRRYGREHLSPNLDKYVFFCAYCVNQWVSLSQFAGSSAVLTDDDAAFECDKFEEVATHISQAGGQAIVALDEACTPLTRIWCNSEIDEYFEKKRDIHFSTSSIFDMQDHHFSDVRKCGASCAEDKARILAKIESRDGGVDHFNERLKTEVKERFNTFRRNIASSQMHMPLKHVDPAAEIQALRAEVVRVSSELTTFRGHVAEEMHASASLRSTVESLKMQLESERVRSSTLQDAVDMLQQVALEQQGHIEWLIDSVSQAMGPPPWTNLTLLAAQVRAEGTRHRSARACVWAGQGGKVRSHGAHIAERARSEQT
ncbi:unnamed protein product, partial [Prorocentrum cordatum]